MGSTSSGAFVNAGVWFLAAVAGASFALKADLSRGFVAVVIPAVTAMTLAGRFLVRQVLQAHLRRGGALHRAVLLGDPDKLIDILEHIRGNPQAGLRVVGTWLPGEGAAAVARLGGLTNLAALDGALISAMRALGADTIVVAGADGFAAGGLRALSRQTEGTGIELLVAPSLADLAGPRIHPRPMEGLPLLQIDPPHLTGAHRLVKDGLDRLGATLLLLLALPALTVIAAGVASTSRGAVLYGQERIGRDGQTFRIWKFRTMRRDADAQLRTMIAEAGHSGMLFKPTQDPRVTAVGRLLRRWSIDELPQLWNVISGSMSLVGPRPQRPSEVALYDDEARRRLLVKPGMTGLWQISGRSDLQWVGAVRLDVYYVDNWSVALDIAILVRTVAAVVRSRGAR